MRNGLPSPQLLIAALLCSTLAAAPAPLAAQGITEGVHVVITGGALAGTYDATSTKGGCSTGINGPGSWGNAFNDSKADAHTLGSLSLIVPSAKAAAAGTKEFLVMLRLGSILGKNTLYTIETRPTETKLTGSGLVTVADAGATAKVTINATTKDGVKIQATIDCKSVTRM